MPNSKDKHKVAKFGLMHFPKTLEYYHREYYPLYYRIYYMKK
jgi:hypothetical protein